MSTTSSEVWPPLSVRDAVLQILSTLEGLGPELRPGLEDTPARVAKMYMELTSGYQQSAKDVLGTQFDVPFDEMVVLAGVRFASLCEHHLLPFYGTATVGYLPGERVVGLSKLARLVQVYARRLQVQERMTVQITRALDLHLEPLGSAVVLRSHHMCMGIRGAMQPEAEMVTSSLTGAFRDKPEARAEFLALARDGV